MSEIRGKTVYAVMFNYNRNEFALTNVMHSLNRAFNYICREEKAIFDSRVEYKLHTIKHPSELPVETQEKCTYICFVDSSDYLKLDIWNRIDFSQFIIVPMIVN